MRCSVSVPLLLKLYKACIPPVGSYGCEIWGQRTVPAVLQTYRRAISMKHEQLLCSIAGLRSTTARPILFKELGEQPLSDSWILRTITFWNGLAALPDHSLFKIIALDDCRDAVLYNIRNWAFTLHKALEKVGYAVTLHARDLPFRDKRRLELLLQNQITAAFQGLPSCPRTGPSQENMLCTYANWFAAPEWKAVGLLKLRVSISLLRCFLKLRCGCHNLPVDSGRALGVARGRRICSKCNLESVCDEYHLVFECTALQDVRARYSHIFSASAPTMRQFVWQKDIIPVMKFVRDGLAILLS